MDNLAIKNFLDSAEFQNGLKEILAKFKIQNKLAGMKEIFSDILSAKVLVIDLPLELIKRLNVPDDLAYEVAGELFPFYFRVTPKALLDQIAKAGTEDSDAKPQYDFKQFMEELKTDSGVKIDKLMEPRLENAVINWLREIRSYQDTFDILTRNPKIGGVGLTEGKANNVLMMLGEKQKELSVKGIQIEELIDGTKKVPQNIQESDIDVTSKVKAPQAVFQNMETEDVTIDQILQQRAQETGRPLNLAPSQPPQELPFVEEIKNEEEFLESTEELPGPQAPVLPVISQPSAPQTPTPQPAEPPRIVPPPIRPPEVRQPLIRQADTASNRPQMSDVKFEPKMYGPLDELAAMSLSDFRRLSKDPWQSIQKISDKLDILDGESVVRKNEGIKALKSSPLYNIYAYIMSRALVEGKTFDQVIAERGDINITEFKAIMELNKSLKY